MFSSCTSINDYSFSTRINDYSFSIDKEKSHTIWWMPELLTLFIPSLSEYKTFMHSALEFHIKVSIYWNKNFSSFAIFLHTVRIEDLEVIIFIFSALRWGQHVFMSYLYKFLDFRKGKELDLMLQCSNVLGVWAILIVCNKPFRLSSLVIYIIHKK